MPAKSRAQWRLFFARYGEKRGKELAQGGTGIRYRSLPERLRRRRRR